MKKEPWNKDINIQNNQLNQMTLIYSIDYNKDSIRIFGKDFVENNKNNCYLIKDGKQKELCEWLNIKKVSIENDKLEIKLIEYKNVTDIHSIFYYCTSLVSVPDISKWNAIDITKMNYMFYNCTSLVSLSDISEFNTANITDICFIIALL